MLTPYGAMLEAHALAQPAHPAVAMPGVEIGYPELIHRVRHCAAQLARDDIGYAGPAGVSIADDLSNLVTSLALLVLGVPQIALPTSDPPAMRRELARRLSLAHVIVDDGSEGIDGIDTVAIGPGSLDDSTPASPVVPVLVDPEAPALYATSSGTTGQSKLIAFSQRLVGVRARQIALTQDFAPDERVMVTLPVATQLGKIARLNALWCGATAILPAGPSSPALSLPDLCASLRVTYLQMTVLQARNLLLKSEGGERLPAFTRVFLGAARMPPGLPREFESRVGGRVYDRYGSTEANLIATTWPAGDEGVPDAVGRLAPGTIVEIVDETGAPCPPDTIGEVRVRAEAMVDGYVDDPVATSLQFRDGWFHPGDMGSITRTGVLRFLGRKDDMMVLNGINIFPAEIERVLEEHSAVRNAAAFPIRSPIYGDIPAAAVELNGTMGVDVPALSAYARERLGVRAPRKVVIVAALPRNANGKVLKRELAAALAQGRTGG
jgi:acyl-CoA synthetase (AMP-forming)/AMP-acid ligase II